MKKEYLEKLKAAGSEKEAAEMIYSFNAGKELSLDELGGVSGGTGEEMTEKESLYWMIDQGMADAVWNYLPTYHGIDADTKYIAIDQHGYEGGIRYVVEDILHLA